MQQRVSIARALGFEPRLLMMDEPFGALDEITRDRLNEQLNQLWRRDKRTVVFVTHSIAEAAYLSTRIVVMSPRPGRILKQITSPLPDERHLGMAPVDATHLFFTIWAATQTYADFDVQVRAVLGRARLSGRDHARAAEHVVTLVLRGCGLA